METYNPDNPPDPELWLALDEQERISLAEKCHRAARNRLPNVTAHATLHVIVENQIALELEPVVQAMRRLMKEGLARHEALHAIGSVVAEYLFDLLGTHQGGEAGVSPAGCFAAVERLTATKWREGTR
ncbi:hypothetical protein [Paraburkholderia sediminicola]|uniref:hypothetical protein n=1 Tax=Paraburkholderia sediminicola TaxID=458836 RepID=UPI0038BA172A